MALRPCQRLNLAAKLHSTPYNTRDLVPAPADTETELIKHHYRLRAISVARRRQVHEALVRVPRVRTPSPTVGLSASNIPAASLRDKLLIPLRSAAPVPLPPTNPTHSLPRPLLPLSPFTLCTYYQYPLYRYCTLQHIHTTRNRKA